jgi:hypothetical protein
MTFQFNFTRSLDWTTKSLILLLFLFSGLSSLLGFKDHAFFLVIPTTRLLFWDFFVGKIISFSSIYGPFVLPFEEQPWTHSSPCWPLFPFSLRKWILLRLATLFKSNFQWVNKQNRLKVSFMKIFLTIKNISKSGRPHLSLTKVVQPPK